MVDSKISSDLIRGHIDTIILRCLMDGDKYGYEISKLVYAGSDGGYGLKEATLYSCLKRLEQEQNIASYWGDETHGGRRRYYGITDKGRKTYAENKNSWQHAKRIIDSLI